jgi:RimJ/RimL family protein N-acetyltransferase
VIRLEAGLCVLRQFRDDDLASLVRHANNRKVWLGVRDRFPHPYTEESGRTWIATASKEDPPTSLAIEVDGAAAGGIGLIPGGDVNRHTAELGYWLGEACWNRGIATAAVRAFIPYARETFRAERLFAEVFSNNLASMRVLEKCGFAREGVLRRHCKKDGEYLDQVVYGLLLMSQ